jgi:hypothetical protein
VVHDAALTTQFIGVEVVITALLLYAASRFSNADSESTASA